MEGEGLTARLSIQLTGFIPLARDELEKYHNSTIKSQSFLTIWRIVKNLTSFFP